MSKFGHTFRQSQRLITAEEVVLMSLGLGFSAAFSGVANAGVNGAICDSLRYKCAAVNVIPLVGINIIGKCSR
jgi:hypothetical protein